MSSHFEPTPTAPDGPIAAASCACGAIQASHIYDVDGIAIMRCDVCGSGRAQVPDDFDPHSFYDEGYFQGRHDDGYADYRGSRTVLVREFAATLDVLARYVPDGRLLEVGCAYGFLLEAARGRYDATGIDISQDAVADCRERGLNAHCGKVEAGFFEGKAPFDAIAMLDVVEHLEHPDRVLNLLAATLRPGGHLLLTTGDFGSVAARIMGRRWRLMTPPQHLHFFTRAGITRTLERAGLDVVALHHPWKTVPLGLIAYQAGRAIGLQAAARRLPLGGLALPVNLFDAMRVIAVKR